MRLTAKSEVPSSAPVVRLRALAAISDAEVHRLRDRIRRSGRAYAARRDILVEGAPVPHPLLVVEGWACRLRLLADGRRQILGFLLPGDLIGFCRHARPLLVSTIAAITEASLVEAPMPDDPDASALGRAYAISSALDEAYLFNHVTRLGRQTAYERIAHLLLEFRERLDLAGLVIDNRFPMPLTQEFLGDTLGLTSVHINRTLQQLRRERMLELSDGVVKLIEPGALAAIADFHPARVSLDQPSRV